MTFTDKQLIRAIFIMNKSNDPKMIKDKDRLMHFALNNILNGKFEFKKGNTLASLAECILINFDSIFMGSKEPLQESFIGNRYFYPPTDVLQGGTYTFCSD